MEHYDSNPPNVREFLMQVDHLIGVMVEDILVDGPHGASLDDIRRLAVERLIGEVLGARD